MLNHVKKQLLKNFDAAVSFFQLESYCSTYLSNIKSDNSFKKCFKVNEARHKQCGVTPYSPLGKIHLNIYLIVKIGIDRINWVKAFW